MALGRADTNLIPYVPRLVLEWQRDRPDLLHQRINGTLVFSDLSGFTAMSERLATLGRLGAEELTFHLDATFTELLTVAAARGGSLLKFGGDALLLFFWGDDHEIRGVAAASEMRARLRAVGRRQTSAGRVTLRMSVGVHAGDVDFFLVGSTHRDLIVSGPSADIVVAMESAADAGEIILSRPLASALPARLSGADRGDGILLARAPRLPFGADVEPAPRTVDAGLFVSPRLRSYLTEFEVEGEHRWLTPAFVHITGVNELLSSAGPSEASRALNEALGAVQEAFDAHGVCQLDCDVYHGGPKVLAVAGAPTAYENDPERMVRALRDARAATVDSPLNVKMGVNFGLAFAGPIGPAWRRTYTVMGDAVNTAARVMAHARPGQLLATPGVLDRCPTLFDIVEQDPFTAKGKAAPVVTFMVGEPTGSRAPARAETLPLVGRVDELDRLMELIAGAQAGAGAAVEIVGDPGMGKTRLVDELVAFSPIPVVRSGCDEYAMATPYAGARPLLAAALGVSDLADDDLSSHLLGLDPSAGPWLPLVGTVLGVDLGSTPEVSQLDPRFAGRRMADVIGRLLIAARPEPTLWVIEDTHWMDEASAELVRRALKPGGPWAVCTNRRPNPERAVKSEFPVLDLEPLNESDALELAHAAVGKRLLPDEVAVIAQRSGGSPLFVRELATVAPAGGELPDRVEMLLSARIDALGPRPRNMLRAASVLGPSSPIDLLDRIVPDWRVTMAEEFLAIDDDMVRFRHRLHQEVAYASISFRTRRELHLRAGDVIEELAGDTAAETLSLHFSEAHDWERSWRYSIMAAKQAKGAYANLDAAVFFRRAVEAARHVDVDPAELGDAWSDMGTAYFYALRPEEADRTARQARHALRHDRLQVARQYFVSAEAARRQRRLGPAMRHGQAGLRALSDDTTAEGAAWRSRLLTSMAGTAQDEGRPARGVEIARRALDEAARSADERPLALAHMTLFMCLAAMGRAEEAMAHSEATTPILEAQNALWQLAAHRNQVGILEFELGNWKGAAASYAAGAETAERAGDVHQTMISTYNLGDLWWRQGRLDQATPAIERVISVWRSTGFAVGVGLAQIVAGYLAGAADRWAEAKALFQEAASALGALGAADNQAEATTGLAIAASLSGHPEESLRQLDAQSETIARHPKDIQARAARAAGLAWAQLRQPETARAELHRAIRLSPGYEEAMTLHAWGQLIDVIGPPPDGWKRTVEDVFSRLDVVWAPAVPAGARNG